MKISYWPDAIALNGKEPYDSFISALNDHGYTMEKENPDSDAAVIWSVLWNGRMRPNQAIWNHYRAKNKPVIVVEVGSLVRNTTWKIGLNGIGLSSVAWNNKYTDERHTDFGIKLKQQCQKDHILICAQHNRSLQWEGMPATEKWIFDLITVLQTKTRRSIIVRPHPRCKLGDVESQFNNVYRQNPEKIHNTHDDFDLEFKGAHAVFSWNSNPGAHAAIAGVHAFVGPESLAAPVSSGTVDNIERAHMPNRCDWFRQLLWTEYTVDEMLLAVSRLKPSLNREIINAMV